MKKWSVFLLMVALGLFTVGCGSPPAPATDAEVEAYDQQMEADMEQMAGQIPEGSSKAEVPAAKEQSTEQSTGPRLTLEQSPLAALKRPPFADLGAKTAPRQSAKTGRGAKLARKSG